MNPRITLRIAAIRRRQAAADTACPSLLRARVPAAQRVLCDTDLNSKPMISRKHQDAWTMFGSGVLLILLIAGFYFSFHVIGVLLEDARKPASAAVSDRPAP